MGLREEKQFFRHKVTSKFWGLLGQDGDFKLTDRHAVFDTFRKKSDGSIAEGPGQIVSIPLSEISSCEISKKSFPGLLFFAAGLVLFALLFLMLNASAGFRAFALVTSFLFPSIGLVIFYFLFQSKSLKIRSSSATIDLDVSKIGIERAVMLIEQIEEAKLTQLVQSSNSRNLD